MQNDKPEITIQTMDHGLHGLRKEQDIVDLKEFMMSANVDKYTFGTFVKKCREEKGYTLRSFAKVLGCSAAYLSDIEKGNRYAPKNYLDKIFEALGFPEEDRRDFEDLAGATRGLSFDDVNTYLGQRPKARVAMRTAMELNASDEDWQSFVENLKRNQG